ncbi:MAG: MlaD family protein, partial [Candidatus Omnitrophica bacterium]|nr:MlaD family protein [Candidatus Omnitrophota bacterium]
MQLNNETKIGIFVVIVLAVLGVITWKAGNFNVAYKGYSVKVEFTSIDGISFNAPVTFNGFEVGRVTDIDIVYGERPHIQLTLWVRDHVKLPKNTEALIKNMGFMGEKYVALTARESTSDFLSRDEVIVGKDPGSFEKILADGEVIAKNLKDISEQVNGHLSKNEGAIDSIISDFRISMKNISSISGNMNERLDVNKYLIDDLVLNLNTTSKNLSEMSE